MGGVCARRRVRDRGQRRTVPFSAKMKSLEPKLRFQWRGGVSFSRVDRRTSMRNAGRLCRQSVFGFPDNQGWASDV